MEIKIISFKIGLEVPSIIIIIIIIIIIVIIIGTKLKGPNEIENETILILTHLHT